MTTDDRKMLGEFVSALPIELLNDVAAAHNRDGIYLLSLIDEVLQVDRRRHPLDK